MKILFYFAFLLFLSISLSSCAKSPESAKKNSNLPTPLPTQVVINRPITPTTDSLGYTSYVNEKLKLNLFYPPDWLVSYDSFANPNYLEVSKQSSVLQIFYNQNLTYTFTNDQKARSPRTENKVIKIDNRQISANETSLDGGGMILTVNLPSLGKKPALTVWFTTDDRSQYRENVIHMLETLRLN